MKKVLFLLLSVFSITLSGCSSHLKPAEPPKCRVVTEITIQTENASTPDLRRYTDPQKMTKALNCLRRLDLWDHPVTDPEASTGTRYRILLTFSDGSAKHYEQIGHTHLRVNGGPWMLIPNDHGIRISLLLAAVPSDAI